MTPEARAALDKLYAFVRKQNGDQDPTRMFNVTPRVAQKLEDKIMQSNVFLKKINSTAVKEITGDTLGFGIPKTITKRTSTADGTGSKRRPSDPTGLVTSTYFCRDIEQDTLIGWDKIDAWAHLEDFYPRIRNMIVFAKARDRLKMAWHGQAASANTDPDEYPELQDVMPGLIQHMIATYPENVLGISPGANGTYTVDEIQVGPGANANGFESLEQLAFHLKQEVVDRLYRNSTDLRILAGDELVVKENTRLYGVDGRMPSEKVARELYLASQAWGGIQRDISDEFPSRGVFVSALGNLSHYRQEGSLREQYDENDHKAKGVVSYSYQREWLGVEEPPAAAVVHPDAILLPTGYDDAGKATGWAKLGRMDGETFVAAPAWKIA